MGRENSLIKIDIDCLDIFPAIVDYDFIKKRPRGGSCRIDFLLHGKLCHVLDDIKILPSVFVKKNGMIFRRGVFLIDFSTIEENAALIADIIRRIGSKKIYIEASLNYPIDSLYDYLDGLEIVLMEFF